MKGYSMTALVFLAMALFFISGICADELPELKFEKYELPNGLDVILHEDHSIPMVSVNVWYHVGSKNEEPGRTGFAHLFEHLMFQGSENHNVLFDDGIDKYGGANNGSTNADRTNYWENMPSNYLEKILWLEADRMGGLLPAITQERLDNQRSVVMNEKRQNYDDQPYGSIYGLSHSMLYPSDHPYSWITIGKMEDLAAASMEDVQGFFKTYYSPNNASLCIAGDFDPEETKKWIENFFGHIPPGPPVKRFESWVPVLTEEVRATVEDNVQLPRLYMAWHTPAYYTPGDSEFDLLASILGSGKSSRLYKALVYDQQIAQDVSVYQASREIGSSFHITVTAKEGNSLEKIESEVKRILDDVLTNGFTVDEFERAKINWETGFVRSLQTMGGFGGRADKLNEYNSYLGDPGKLRWDKNRYTAATADGILSYARKYLKPESRIVIHVHPQGNLAKLETGTDMAIEPGPQPDPSFTPPNIQQAKLSNGMDLYLVENHRLPLVQMNLIIKGGWATDPTNRPGAGSLTSELLNEGTSSRNALEISDAFRRLGANFGVNSSFDNSTVSLNVLKEKLDPALDVMADVVINPSFPDEELQRQKKIYLGRIKQESLQAISVGFKGLLRELYGKDHPYAQPYTGTGTEESITAISRSDIENYYKANYLPNNSAAVVVGDITLDEAKSKLEKAFKKWKKGTAAKSTVATVNSPNKTKIHIIDKPGAAQSTIMLGNLINPRKDSKHLPATVVSEMLGGGSIARLYMNLRQDKGYTYGAYSFLTARRAQGAMIAYSQVQTDITKEALVEFMKEMRGITGQIPISDEELINAKNSFTKGFPQDFQTVGGIAEQMADLVTYDLPMDEWKTYIDRVNKVDIDKAVEIANAYIHPDQLTIVIVGDREKIESNIRDLKLGDVIISSAD